MNAEEYMSRAVELAKLGLFTTDPNPRVGCVIVNDGVIVGEGYHKQAGGPHAEVHAIAQAGWQTKGATAYVTLEPCSHTGRTPPCANALIQARVSEVVIGMQDPNPQVSGRGVKMLQDAGIKVSIGICESECKALNPGFIKRMITGKPWVRLKVGMSLDGRTAMKDGTSQWITGPESRQDVQYWRSRSSAIVTGKGTFEFDNPRLNARSPNNQSVKQPLRVLLDGTGSADISKAFFKPNLQQVVNLSEHANSKGENPNVNMQVDNDHQVWWCTGSSASVKDSTTLAKHIRHLLLPEVDGKLDLDALLNELASADVNEVLFECGASLAGSVIKSGILDELVVYIAPKIMGSSARPMAEIDIQSMHDTVDMKLVSHKTFGDDIRLVFRRQSD